MRELYQRLRADGFEPWLDEEDLLPGQDWQREIPKAVRQSDVVIVCLSKGSINKAGYVQKEIKFALDVADEQPEDTIFLIPLKLEECEVPERLSRWQWVNHFDPNGYARLMKALRARANSLRTMTSSTQSSSRQPAASPPVQASPSIGTISEVVANRTTTTTIIPGTLTHGLRKTPIGWPNGQIWAGIEFVRIPAGKSLMGSKDDNKLASDDEKPQHTVEISYDYWVARYPVTNDQFAAFVGATMYVTTAETEGGWSPGRRGYVQGFNWQYPFGLDNDPKSKGDHPVAQVSWHDAMAYCKWLRRSLALRNQRLAGAFVYRSRMGKGRSRRIRQ